MPWIIGIDEAGYGPNLGPLVMTAVACRMPAWPVDLWQLLRAAVRRDTDKDDGRLLVADSKVVYSAARGLQNLETSVLAMLAPGRTENEFSLARYVERVAPAAVPELQREAWYTGRSPLPVAADVARCGAATALVREALRSGEVVWGAVRSVVVCPPRFNQLLDEHGSKGAVLGHGLTQLVQESSRLPGDEPLHFFIDKHGGRNTYAPMVQHAVGEGMVIANQESMARSVYRVVGARRDMRLTFQPRADAEHFCVALASMASKYLREVLMREFNRFWQEQVPGLKPTAGYPTDATRFLETIRPALPRLGLAEAAVWRRK